jgi:hypothetical protein
MRKLNLDAKMRRFLNFKKRCTGSFAVFTGEIWIRFLDLNLHLHLFILLIITKTNSRLFLLRMRELKGQSDTKLWLKSTVETIDRHPFSFPFLSTVHSLFYLTIIILTSASIFLNDLIFMRISFILFNNFHNTLRSHWSYYLLFRFEDEIRSWNGFRKFWERCIMRWERSDGFSLIQKLSYSVFLWGLVLFSIAV